MGGFHLHVRTILNPKFQYSTINRFLVMQDMNIRTHTDDTNIRTSAHRRHAENSQNGFRKA
ncbi:hypothetical protein O3M35_001351 [Rhynocoris fuscipes]|uniref:Uncharacterized protein n=1 Tax=Rhynocoris fuscipes TaxID=488301 RepID=A0AAW1DS42_9HEMI